MARYAIIDQATDLVINVAEWSGNVPWKPGGGVRVVRTDVAGPGWTHDPQSGEFSPPPDSETPA